MIEIAENTFFIRGAKDAKAAVLTFHELNYDGSSIFMEYSVTGEPSTRVIAKEELTGRNLYDVEPLRIQHMDQQEIKVYDVLIRGKNEAVCGFMWDVDVHNLMDAQGKSLQLHTDLSGMGGTIYDPVSGIPVQYHTRISLNVMPDGEGVGDHLARQQTLIDKEEITVLIPLQIKSMIMTQEDGKAMYAPGTLVDSGIVLPVTISRSENRAVSVPWRSMALGDAQVSVWPNEWGQSGMYLRAQSQDETSDALLTVYSSGAAPRAYNAEADIAVSLLDQADDPYGYLSVVQDYLDRNIDVNSVLLRYAVPGTPVAKDDTPMDAYLDVRAAYDDWNRRWTWTYTWKEGADLAAFDGMDFVELQIPVVDARIYARYDESGSIHAGMETIPVPGDSLTAQIMLP